MAADDIAQLTEALAKTHVGDGELSFQGLGLKLDNAGSGQKMINPTVATGWPVPGDVYTHMSVSVYICQHLPLAPVLSFQWRSWFVRLSSTLA